MTPRRSSLRAAAGGIAALVVMLVAVLGAPQAAWAHAELVDTEPGPGETVENPPTAITLTFSEELLDAGADVVVSEPDAEDLTASAPVVDGHLVTVQLAALDDGDYEVMWRVVSADGHPVLGSFSFFVSAVDEPDAGTAAPTTPAAVIPPDAAPAAAGPIGIGAAGWMVGLTAALAGTIGVTVWILRARRGG